MIRSGRRPDEVVYLSELTENIRGQADHEDIDGRPPVVSTVMCWNMVAEIILQLAEAQEDIAHELRLIREEGSSIEVQGEISNGA
jgi:hypothetical protein